MGNGVPQLARPLSVLTFVPKFPMPTTCNFYFYVYIQCIIYIQTKPPEVCPKRHNL